MPTKQFERPAITPPVIHDQQYFIVCGPSTATDRGLEAFRKFFLKHFFAALTIITISLFLLGAWWASYDYPGATTFITWRCEIAAAVLALLTLQLYRTFRHWEIERQLHHIHQRKRDLHHNPLYCTPPPIHEARRPSQSQSEEIAIVVEHWITQEPAQLSEEDIEQTVYPDEAVAPDALIIQFDVKKAA